MRYAIFMGVASLWFLLGSIVSSWVDGNTAFAGTISTAAISATSATVDVQSSAGFPAAPNYVVIEDEVITYTSTNATAFMGLTRGVNHPNLNEASRAVAHVSGSHVYSLEQSVLNSLLGFNIDAITTSYGTFGIIDFGVAAWNFFKNIPRLLLFDYAFLKGPYNPATGTNDPSDIVIVRLGLICIFTVPGIVGLILILRMIFFRGTVP